MKKQIATYIDSYSRELEIMGDKIFDFKELSYEEVQSAGLLENELEKMGFKVYRGIAGLPTAFKGVYENGKGGISIGLLCEYDALKGLGHGCGHHLQGPTILGAAKAIKDLVHDIPYKLVVYGTPGEETHGGKIQMVKEGCFQDVDFTLIVHGDVATRTDVKSMALTPARVIFHGKSSHAAIKPEMGRSALDAMLLAFNGIEFLREHVKDDTRMNYSIAQAIEPANIVPAEAIADFDLRSYNSFYLDKVIKRFENIVKGAALMTDTTYEIKYEDRYESKIPSYVLNQTLMDNAKLVGAPNLQPAREKTGSTDYGNVVFQKPGAVIRIAFAPENSVAHSVEYVAAGKSSGGHKMINYGAKIVALTIYDVLSQPALLKKIQNEYAELKEKMGKEGN